ncbi:MAG: hypothetical protein ABW084_05560, partial [Candidatus Thiodiazotropha sp.]
QPAQQAGYKTAAYLFQHTNRPWQAGGVHINTMKNTMLRNFFNKFHFFNWPTRERSQLSHKKTSHQTEHGLIGDRQSFVTSGYSAVVLV